MVVINFVFIFIADDDASKCIHIHACSHSEYLCHLPFESMNIVHRYTIWNDDEIMIKVSKDDV